jgi:hypothetical protein
MTKKYKKKYQAYTALSIIITLVPILIYVILGFQQGTIGQKVTLGVCLLTAIILVIMNLLFKHIPRCGLWIVLTGLAYACNSITVLLLIMALTTALDELILSPLANKYKQLYIINKEIDKRPRARNKA